jgi:hypothetical protein
MQRQQNKASFERIGDAELLVEKGSRVCATIAP